ncbi:MAG: PKD domain-containing protein [Bacteroidales bacterium]|nr:PKD domain-containing protein [Bacteroidales bacterium]
MKHFTSFLVSGIILFFLAISVNAQNYSFPDAWNNHGFTLLKSRTSDIEINFSVSEFSLNDVVINGEAMKDISISGNFLFNNEGAPNLPGNGKFIAIPNGCVPLVEIISSRKEVFNNINLAPAPNIPKDDEKGPLHYNKDPRIYNVDALYPAEPVILSETRQLRGIDAVMLGITPFQYNPVTKQLIVYRDMKVKISFQGGTGSFGEDRLRSRWWDPILEDAIFNFSQLPKINYDSRNRTSGPSEETGAEYLIITPDGLAFQQYADSIKKFRTEQGILTMVKTLSQIGGNTTLIIENYINNAYNTWTIPPATILLLGDFGSDINSTVISPIYDNYCASDNIYGDVDNDQLPDIVMARITANNLAQLQVMVSKFLNYERNPPTSASFYDHPITALGWQTERWFQLCSETVGGYWKNVQGKNPVRINEIYDGTPGTAWSTAPNTSTVVSYFGPAGLGYIPESPATLGNWSGGNATDINNAINAGSFMLQHRDHGAESGWGEPAYYSSNIDGLTNTDLTYIMSINCLTGKYNYSSEVFAEKFHRYTYGGQNSGALGIMAASEVSYSFVNDAYVWGMYDNLWPDFMPDYGTTPASRDVLPAFGNAAGKIFLESSGWPYNTGDKEVTYHLFHHHGDAFLTVYSEVPQNLTVTHNPVLYAGVTTFEVTANAGSFIALTSNGVILGTATGTGFPVSINIPGQVPPDQMIVTITKQNFYRYSSVVDVVPATGPYVVYSSNSISDPIPGGNNNGLMDYGETNLISVSLRNVGIAMANNVSATLSTADPYITITDPLENYGNIDPNQTVSKSDAFSLILANNVPDQYIVPFTLNCNSGTDTWTSHFNIVANAPSLVIGAMTIQDNGPGCNNDGILDPGETANLLIATSNNGHSSLAGITGNLAISGGSSAYLSLVNSSSTLGTLNPGGSTNAVFVVTADPSTPIGTPVDLEYTVIGGAYNVLGLKQVVIGLIPTYNMTNAVITTCPGNFYDSGGASGAYLDSENYTETFYPSTPGNMIRFTFNSFETESGYDYLRIYNGTSTAAPLIGTYHGTAGPGTVTASNAAGALTFNFTSDGSVTKPGWSAGISCYNNNIPPVAGFTASSTTTAINSTVTFSDQSANIPTSWSWSFTPGTVIFMGGTDASSQNPQVQFTSIGTYDVTLTVTNAFGSNTIIKSSYINVLNYQYCTPTFTSGTSSGDFITLVQLGSINNATGASTSPYYTYYSSLSTDLLPGNSYSITLSPGTYSSGNYIAVWIDYNINGVFETTEKLGTISIAPTPATGSIAFSVPATALTGTTRMRVREVWNNSSIDPCLSYSYGETEDYNVNIVSSDKNLNLTVLLESLYSGQGMMRKAQNSTGDQFQGNIADQITIELHSADHYGTVVYSLSNVNLSIDGVAQVIIPGIYNGTYYLTVKGRNAIETTSNTPVSFNPGTINYSFENASMAYGSNLKQMPDNVWVVYCGDVNQDGVIDSQDMNIVSNQSSSFSSGYIPEDINGDGLLDAADFIIVDNCASHSITKITP